MKKKSFKENFVWRRWRDLGPEGVGLCSKRKKILAVIPVGEGVFVSGFLHTIKNIKAEPTQRIRIF